MDATVRAGVAGLARRERYRGSAGHFDAVASGWLQRYQHRPSFRTRLARTSVVLSDLLQRYDSPVVLDFGGGAGVFAAVVSEAARLVVLMDRSEAMLNAGRQRPSELETLLMAVGLRCEHGRVSRVRGHYDALRSDVPTFHVVMAIAVLEYLADFAEAIEVFSRLLLPGGCLVFTVPRPRSLVRRVERPVDWAGRWAGRVIRQPVLRDREYSLGRPHGSRLPWSEVLVRHGLDVEASHPLPLGDASWRRLFVPNELVVARRVPVGTGVPVGGAARSAG